MFTLANDVVDPSRTHLHTGTLDYMFFIVIWKRTAGAHIAPAPLFSGGKISPRAVSKSSAAHVLFLSNIAVAISCSTQGGGCTNGSSPKFTIPTTCTVTLARGITVHGSNGLHHKTTCTLRQVHI